MSWRAPPTPPRPWARRRAPGASPLLPPPPGETDDAPDLTDHHGATVPMGDHTAPQAPPLHTRTRSLMNTLLTPKRLKENEEFMWRLADQQLDTFLAKGQSEFLADYAK